MTFKEAIVSCYSNYATFSGRASRSEYWFFTLYHFLLVAICIALFSVGIVRLLLAISFFANILPSISVLVRRLHDTDRSGWWYWFVVVPLIGPIMMLVWFCTCGTFGDNRFGSNPLATAN